MEESNKSQYKYCLIVKNREILKGSGVNVSLIIIHWKPYATYNNKKSTSLSLDNKVDKYILHYMILIYLKAYILCFMPKRALSWNKPSSSENNLSFSNWIPYNS